MQIRFLSSPSSSRRRRRRLRPVLFKFLRAEGPSVFSSSLVPPFGNYYQARHSVDWLRNGKVTRSSCQWFHKSPIFLYSDGCLISLSRQIFIRRFISVEKRKKLESWNRYAPRQLWDRIERKIKRWSITFDGTKIFLVRRFKILSRMGQVSLSISLNPVMIILSKVSMVFNLWTERELKIYNSRRIRVSIHLRFVISFENRVRIVVKNWRQFENWCR